MEDNNEPSDDGNMDELPLANENSLVDEEILGLEREHQKGHLNESESNARSSKRGLNEDEPWYVVGKNNKEKKVKTSTDKIEVLISSLEKLPKQFALAKLLKEYNITDIQKVKYLNPYKIRLEMPSEVNIEKLENCHLAKEKGWRIQRPMEKMLSYGVIRDVDLELTDDDIFKSVECSKPAELMSALRLKQRDDTCKDGWSASEVVRLCFKGNFLPAHVFVDGLRLKVDPYIFPVSQCSRCWKLGHTHKRCPSSKVMCPKCGNNHANCETNIFKCTNCKGPHMSLSRSCPMFLKEKKLRELMAEYNCTYRKALTVYVAPESPDVKENDMVPTYSSFPLLKHIDPTQPPPSVEKQTTSTYAAMVETKAIVHREERREERPPRPRRVKRHLTPGADHNIDTLVNDVFPESERGNSVEEDKVEDRREENVDFSELVNRLKEILFLKGLTMQVKVDKIIGTCIQWIILVCVDKLSSWPILKSFMDYFINGK
jgi:hypothetical protein